MRIDIGCGLAKTQGFVGLDRFFLPGVDIVCSLDQGIPLADSCVDYVIASHSLEHFSDVQAIIKEIFRICKDRAILTIAGPYSSTRLNQANPYHLSTFNEHTPRFWSASPDWPLDWESENFPGIPDWGLSRSDNSSWVSDIRVLKAEYFYFPQYRSLKNETKNLLRQKLSNICDEFIFHCLVVKSPIKAEELYNIKMGDFFLETPHIPRRRALELVAEPPDLIVELTRAPDKISRLEQRVMALEEELETLKKNFIL